MEGESVALGREAFRLHCAACHGPEGTGGSVAPTLAAREFLSSVNDQQLEWLIAGGVPGTTMGAYHIDLGGPFTPQEITRLVRYLRALEAGAPSVPEWRAGAKAPPRAVASPDSAAATVAAPTVAAPGPEPAPSPVAVAPGTGTTPAADARDQRPAGPDAAALYAGSCAACHGPAGEGTPVAVRIRPPHARLTDDSLRIVIARGRPGTAMMAFGQGAGGRLSPADVDALVGWLRAATPRP